MDIAAARRVRRLLGTLRERQRGWVAGELDEHWERPEEVRAQQLVLRLEKGDQPRRADVLAAAARASLAQVADPRSDQDGPWHEDVTRWIDGRIRKVARRARGAHWRAAEVISGVTVTVPSIPERGDSEPDDSGLAVPGVVGISAQVRAFPPYVVSAVPKHISRLQVGGTDLVDGDVPSDAPDGLAGPVLWLAPGVEMTVGKAMAQVGHASMLLAAYVDESELADWLTREFPLAVRRATPARWTKLSAGPADPEQRWNETGAVVVRDAGFTEIEPGTVTVWAQW